MSRHRTGDAGRCHDRRHDPLAGKIRLAVGLPLPSGAPTLFDNQVFGFTLLAVTAAWIAGEVVGFVRKRIPVLDL